MGKTVILDNGHAGMINGKYSTPGKRSPNWSKGVLYEGAFNRWIVNGIMRILDRNKVPYYHVSPELRDIQLQTRVRRANKIYSNNRDTYLLSIHANAGGDTGIEGFTSPGETRADHIADTFLKNFEAKFPSIKTRFDYSDGDRDKEAAFYVLRETSCPAFLFECGFMDNQEDYMLLTDPEFQDMTSANLAGSIMELYNG